MTREKRVARARVVEQFPTEALADVSYDNGALKAAREFHEHTESLLKASLRLEQG